MRTTETFDQQLTEQDLLPSLIHTLLNDGNAITLWRMPRSDEKHLLVCTEGIQQLDEISLEESKTGFVFAPFDRLQKKMFFRGNLILTFRNGTIDPDTIPDELMPGRKSSDINDKPVTEQFPVGMPATPVPADYRELVTKSISVIQQGLLEKIVPSRTRTVPLPSGFDILKSFDRLCKAYPDAMVSLVSSEETGTWMGASPELIVSIDEKAIFRTVALAGTQRYEPPMNLKTVAWTEKEIEEQALVSRYIISCFKKIRVREYDEHGPRTSVAGNLLHLKTEYKVDMAAINFSQLGSVMLKLLHPTSAVCGMPLEPAQHFLKENEGYDRQFYAGFLGPVNFKNESHIYVNLRCLQLLDKTALLYAGAGVTIDSTPDKEWDETEMKLNTLLSIIY